MGPELASLDAVPEVAVFVAPGPVLAGPGRLSMGVPFGPIIVVARLPFLRTVPCGTALEVAAIEAAPIEGAVCTAGAGAVVCRAVVCPLSRSEDSDCGDWSLTRFCLFESLRTVGDWFAFRKPSNLAPSLAKSAMDLVHFLTSSVRALID